MSISLYKHNEEAYITAVRMLADTGRAAVVHPTGTGKSFIAFRLCEDNPDKNVCWLSPSEYIFRTQTENLTATGAAVPQNIRFFTYARLMLMGREEIAAIRPDFIILDEFHRCGAEKWGAGVRTLLDLFPDVPVLGLSATAIRYLDNRRNMADELFGGCVASEITLGDAIVRGILNPPKYVLSAYSISKELDKLRQRVSGAKNRAVRAKAEVLFEALRRAIEKADGLDVIFDRHMTDRHGKYLVFCSDAEHMREMSTKVPEWFSRVDPEPHVYSAYSDDPATEESFAAFKADDGDHLKLLFCIDMLNEGIHVDGVSGVILLRPTVSPIIYKQQIGRALSADKKKTPIIFDIVLNIENLCSIDAVEEEMQIAAAYYRANGQAEEIVNEHFTVTDELRDCVELFSRLNEMLTASWETMYALAERYAAENGNLNVPKRFVSEGGYPLGSWLCTQRRVRRGELSGNLTPERIAKLDALGMVWEPSRDVSFEKYLRAAEAYTEQNGNLAVSADTVTTDGIRLGSWIAQLRNYRKSGIRRAYLTPERIEALDRIGMIWDVPDYLWEKNFAACLAYYRENGDLNVPPKYVTVDGIRLGSWIRRQRQLRAGKLPDCSPLTPAQIDRLDELGVIWKSRTERSWEDGLTEAKKYRARFGSLNVPQAYVAESGFRLGAWISDRREAGREKTPKDHAEALDALGMIWQKPDPWQVRYAYAKEYFDAHGDLKLPANYQRDGIWMAKWLNEQRQIYLGKRPGKTLTREQENALREIGFDFSSRRGERPARPSPDGTEQAT